MPSGARARAGVRVDLLGRFAVSVDGVPVETGWRLRKAKTLVKLLALAPGCRLHRDVLSDHLWPDLDAAAAANNFHQALHGARKALGPQHLVLRDDVVTLCPDTTLTLDVVVFEEAAATARAAGDIAQLRATLDLYGGDLLPEEAYAEWAGPTRDRYRQLHTAVSMHLAAALGDAGRADEAVEVLEPLAVAHPLDEPVHVALVEALAASGRRWDAVAVYERLRDRLDLELATTPAPTTKEVYRRLLGAGGAAPTSTPHNLPASATSFIGRERALHELATLLDRARLVTLTGPGGSGKSRLGVELARRRLAGADHADGVWLAELASLTDAELVPSAVALAVGTPLAVDRPPGVALADQLADRRVLLLVDNCEHLLDACADLVATLLARCPDVVVLTTSREPLGLPGETTWRVPSLELPAPTADVDVEGLARLEAVQLFVERAREALPSFRLDQSTATAVAYVCYRLDGIPLALELAAARLAHLSVTQLADRLGDALAVLASRGRGRLDRQQTIAATLDWSYELLDGEERVLFRRLAVFAGGFDADTAVNVAGNGIASAADVLARLVDKSLVLADTGGATARYRLLEVVRQYAYSRVAAAGELARCRRRHREWYADRAYAHDPDRTGPVVGEPSVWFDVEQDNLRAAMASALAEDPPRALQLAASTWRFWMTRGQIAEGARWLTLALDGCREESPLRARALFGRSVFMIRQGQADPLLTMAEEIAELDRALDNGSGVAQGAHDRSVLLFMAGDWSRAYPLVEETVAAARGLPTLGATAEHFAGFVALGRGDVAAARLRFERASTALSQVPDDASPFFTTVTLAWVVDERSDPALPYGEDTMLLGRRVGAEQARGYVAASMALCERLDGRIDEAGALLDDAVGRFRAVGDAYGAAYAVSQRGHTARWAGDLDLATRCLTEAEQMRRGLRDQRAIALAVSGQALVEAHAGRGGRARALAEEAATMMERSGDGAGLALTATNIAVAEVLLGDVPAALGALERALSNQRIPGGHRSVGWQHLMRARLRSRLGKDRGATESGLAALGLFTAFGDQQGLDAVQRARKAGWLTLPDD